MKTINAKIFRETNVSALTEYFMARGEDVKRTAAGSIAFPVVAEDGEEGWLEIVVKVPKWNEDDDGYSRAEEYAAKVIDQEERAATKEAERKRKEAERAAKKAEKEAKKAEKEAAKKANEEGETEEE